MEQPNSNYSCAKCASFDMETKQKFAELMTPMEITKIIELLAIDIKGREDAIKKTADIKLKMVHRMGADISKAMIGKFLISLNDKASKSIKKILKEKLKLEFDVQHAPCPHKDEGHEAAKP